GPIARFQGELAPLASGIDPVIEPASSGLAAWAMQIAAGTQATAPAHPDSGGRFYVVIDGHARRGDKLLPALACVCTYAEEPPVTLAASETGARVLVLQFPTTALAPRPGEAQAA